MPASKSFAPKAAVLALLLGLSAPGEALALYNDAKWDVRVTDGITYGQGRVDGGATWKDLELTLYEPVDNPDPLKPAIVFVHGGGFTGGSRYSMAGYGNHYAERGYVAVSITYRLLGENPTADPDYDFWPTNPGLSPAVHAAAVDAARAVRWLRANAGAYGIDPNFVFAGGISAGGITVGNLAIAGPEGTEAYTQELPGDVPLAINNPGESSKVQAVLDYCGGAGPALPDPTDAPMLLIHTVGDGIVPVLLPDLLSGWYGNAPAPIEYYRLPGGSHCSFLGGLVDGLSVNDVSTRFLDRMVWEVPTAPMLSQRLLLKDSPTKPERRKLVFNAQATVGSEALTVPAPGSDGAPTEVGMMVEVYASTGDPDDYARFHLPAEGWSVVVSGTKVKYRYSDKRQTWGAVKTAKLQDGKLKIVAKGAAIPALSGAPHGAFSVRTRIGTKTPWCATATASSVDSDSRFLGQRQVLPENCADRPPL